MLPEERPPVGRAAKAVQAPYLESLRGARFARLAEAVAMPYENSLAMTVPNPATGRRKTMRTDKPVPQTEATVADLLALPSLRAADRQTLETAFGDFVARFDAALASAMEFEGFCGEAFMARVSCDVLLEAGDQYGCQYSLVRLAFDGQPVALLRCTHDERKDSCDREPAAVRLTCRAAADRMADAMYAELKAERLAESAGDETAGDLLDFGPTADIDLQARAMRFLSEKRLMMMSCGEPVAVLLRVEDGSLVVDEQMDDRTEVRRGFGDGEDAAALFMAAVEIHAGRVAGGWHTRPAIVHCGDGVGVGVGLFLTGEGVRCASLGAGKTQTVQAEGGAAVPAFLGMVRGHLIDALGLGADALQPGPKP